jgi:Flp pilus assembly protein TadG
MLTECEHMQTALIGRKRRRLGGQTLIEFTLALPLLLLTLSGVLNTGWLIYRTATLQFAVREACRFAVTNQTMALTDTSGKSYGVIESARYIVQKRAMGFLGSKTTDTGYSFIHVRYYNPSSSFTTPDTSATANQGGNIVEVSVEGFIGTNLVAFMPSFFPISPDARSADRIEGTPIGGLPPMANYTPTP